MDGTTRETKSSNALVARAGLVALVLASTLTLIGCNTTEGAGKDIESLGEGIKDTARDAKN